MNTRALPFTFASSSGGSTGGLVRVQSDALDLEFKEWAWMKMSHQIVIRRLDLGEVDEVRFTTGLFGARLTLAARSMHAFDGLPTKRPGELELRFSRSERKEAEVLYGHVNRIRSEAAFQKLFADSEDDDYDAE